MTEILPPTAPMPRSFLGWDGTRFRVFTLDPLGHLQADVLSMPDLGRAFHSAGEDRLVVRGEDQLHSYQDTLDIHVTGDLTEVDGYLESGAVGAGDVWVITNIILENEDAGLTATRWCRVSGGVVYCFGCETRAIPAAERLCWHSWEWAKEDDTIRGQFVGGGIGDTCHMWITGHVMTKETGRGPGPSPAQEEDFTGWVEVDPAGDLTIVADQITIDSLLKTEDAYVYLDKDPDYFGDFRHYISARMTDSFTTTGFGIWGLSNGAHTLQDKADAGEGLVVHLYFTAGGQMRVYLRDRELGTEDYYEGGYNTSLWFTIERFGIELKCRIYSDAARTILVDTLIVVCATTRYRYIETLQSTDAVADGARDSDGWIRELSW